MRNFDGSLAFASTRSNSYREVFGRSLLLVYGLFKFLRVIADGHGQGEQLNFCQRRLRGGFRAS